MKVVHVPRRFVTAEWGGTETTILQLCRAMIAKGHQALIHTSLALSKTQREEISGVEVIRHSYSYPFFGLSADEKMTMDKKGGNMLSLSLLWSLLREGKVDLFHAHTGKRVGAAVRTAARLRKVPYVITLHGGIFDVPEGESSQMLEPIANKFEWGRVFGVLMGSRSVLEDAAAVICVGENEWRAASKALPGKRVEFMPNGVDTDFFAEGNGAAFRRQHGIAEESKVILCLSRIDYQKNQVGLVEALPALLESQPDAHLLIVGPVTIESYRDTLCETISRHKLEQRVSLLPGISFGDPALADAYHAADVFCLPSLHEPFGIVILEAWAAGLPVVAANVGGIPSFTTNEENVLLVDPQKPAELTTALDRVLSDNELAGQLGNNGRSLAQEVYDWSVIGERVMSIYRDLLDEGAA